MSSTQKNWKDLKSTAEPEWIVTTEQFERELKHARQEGLRSAEGMFGPDSMIWRVMGDNAGFLGLLSAVLLQGAHPAVGHAVYKMSDYKTDPLRRYVSTLFALADWMLGSRQEAENRARNVHRIHGFIKGTYDHDIGLYKKGEPFAANDERALLWVQSTGVEVAMQYYELVYGPVSMADKNQYYAEHKRFLKLFGLRDAMIPGDWSEFQEYYQSMLYSGALAVDEYSRDLAKYLFTPQVSPFQPLHGTFINVGVGLLPAHLKEAYGIAWGRNEQTAFERNITLARSVFRVLPWKYRKTYFCRQSLLRVSGKPKPVVEQGVDWLIESIAKFAGGQLSKAA